MFSKKNVSKAFESLSVKQNGGGTDKCSMDDLRNYWELNSSRILEEIEDETFKPEIVKEYEIINGKGKRRQVTSFTPQDKLITKLLAQKLNDFFEPIFLEESFAYRRNRGTLQAVERAKEYIEANNEYVVEVDIQNFFDEINLDLLLTILKRYINDKRVLFLLKAYLCCTISNDGEVYAKTKGIVQGNSMSPCLSNIYLTELDEFLTKMSYRWIRYADNIYIYIEKENDGIDIFRVIKELLSTKFFLPINEKKSGIFDVYDRRLLGYDFYKRHNKVKIEKHVYQRNEYYRNWHECTIEKINKEYHITKAGVLNKKDYALLFENDNEKHHIPIETTEQLDIYNEITLTSAVIRTLSNGGIRLGIYDRHGDLLGYFVPETFNQDAKTVIAQCEEYANEKKRLQTARAMEIAAIHNIRANTRYYKKTKNKESLGEIEKLLTEGIVKLNQCKSVDELLLEEARCRQIYYQSFNYMLDSDFFYFERRSKRPPLDAINA